MCDSSCSPAGIYTSPSPLTTLIIYARTCLTCAVFMSVKIYGSLLEYGQFNSTPNPFPGNASHLIKFKCFPVLLFWRLFPPTVCILSPLMYTLTQTHKHNSFHSRWIWSAVEMKATELIALASIYWCGEDSCATRWSTPSVNSQKQSVARICVNTWQSAF